MRGTVALLEAETGLLAVEAALGHPQAAGRIRHRIGEGIPGRAVESGAPVLVPQEVRETGEEVTILGVPILLDGAAVGALTIELPYEAERDCERMVKVLRIAAGMISQALRIQQLVGQERERLVEENTQLRQELQERYEFTNLIGNSGPMRRVYEQVAQVVGTGATVLIRGESGTGKELIAHALHHHSPRAGRPFVRVNCAALPETLVESELFGYERGAVHRRRRRAGRAGSSWPTAARSSSTRSASCRSPPRPSCCACSRSASSSGVGGTQHGAGRRARSSRPPTRTWSRRSRTRRVPGGPLLPAQRRSRSACRRSASGSRTTCSWPTTSWTRTRSARPQHQADLHPDASTC